MARRRSRALTSLLVPVLALGCQRGDMEGAPVGERAFGMHASHSGSPPWPHVLTCYGGCEAPHYDPSACNHSTSCGPIANGRWWYSTERMAFHCGAKLKLQRGDRCVVVDVQDNGPADWVEDNALARCGVGYIIDTSPLVADYFGGGCGWGECFIVQVSPVPDDTPTGPAGCCECEAGQVQTDGCGNCGTRTRRCGGDCRWNAWSTCEGQGACSPGSTDSRDCCDCGSQARTCSGSCEWRDWDACSGPDPDGGNRVCDTGEPGPCAEGRVRCVEGCTACVRIHDPVPELCDTVDNDCSGDEDDGMPQDMGDPPPPYAARQIDVSFPTSLQAGGTASVWAQFVNVGTETWSYPGVALVSVTAREGSPSLFFDDESWPAWDVAAVVADEVSPSETLTAAFTIRVPDGAAGEIEEQFGLMAPDGEIMKCPSPYVNVGVAVVGGEPADAGGGEEEGTGEGGLEGGCACGLAPGEEEGGGTPLALVLLMILLAAGTRRRGVWAVLLAAASSSFACRPAAEPRPVTPPAYVEEIEAWHADRIAGLKKENGWLSLAGLFWLDEGESTVGSDPGSDIVFPASAPAAVGTLTLEEGTVTLKVEAGVEALGGGQPVGEMTMRSDEDPAVEPDRVTVGPLTFLIIVRGGKKAVRLYDRDAEALETFKGIERFPVDIAWRIEAVFEPYDQPKKILVPTVIKTTEEAVIPGEVRFTVDGKACRLLPITEEGAEELFFVFGDETTGKETCGTGRFLDAPLPKEGVVVLDFNKAVNPPCAFTPYATCYLPPEENRLPIAVTAGEKKYGSN